MLTVECRPCARTRLSAALSAALGITGMLPASVLAQEQGSETADDLVLEEVVVTGSRIVTEDGFGRTSLVTVVGMEEIGELGFSRIEDVLNLTLSW